MNNYQQYQGSYPQQQTPQQPPFQQPQQFQPQPPPGGGRLLGPVNWRFVRISTPIIAVVLGLLTVLAWPTIKDRIHPAPAPTTSPSATQTGGPTTATVALHKLDTPAGVTLPGLTLKMVPHTDADKPSTDADTQRTGRNKQFLGLTRLSSTTYSPDGALGTPPGYQVFAAYGDIQDPQARMDQAVANLKLVGAQQLGSMQEFPAAGQNSGDVAIHCIGLQLNNAQLTTEWCTWSNRSTIGTVALATVHPGPPTTDDLKQLAANTAALRDQMYVAP